MNHRVSGSDPVSRVTTIHTLILQQQKGLSSAAQNASKCADFSMFNFENFLGANAPASNFGYGLQRPSQTQLIIPALKPLVLLLIIHFSYLLLSSDIHGFSDRIIIRKFVRRAKSAWRLILRRRQSLAG